MAEETGEILVKVIFRKSNTIKASRYKVIKSISLYDLQNEIKIRHPEYSMEHYEMMYKDSENHDTIVACNDDLKLLFAKHEEGILKLDIKEKADSLRTTRIASPNESGFCAWLKRCFCCCCGETSTESIENLISSETSITSAKDPESDEQTSVNTSEKVTEKDEQEEKTKESPTDDVKNEENSETEEINKQVANVFQVKEKSTISQEADEKNKHVSQVKEEKEGEASATTVYIAPLSGIRYHSTSGCYGLRNAYTIQAVSIADVGFRTPCLICYKSPSWDLEDTLTISLLKEEEHLEACKMKVSQEIKKEVSDAKEQIVYIAPLSGIRYHSTNRCGELSNACSIEPISIANVGFRTPCLICYRSSSLNLEERTVALPKLKQPERDKTIKQKVFIAPYSGQKYHSKPNCRGLSRALSVEGISIDDVGFRTPCLICW